jgi:beta-galactosidase
MLICTMSNRPIHFGAVYFRGTNPPLEDWERDYAVAAEDGHSLFRHWFCWNNIERAPGRFVWDDYDRQLDLAAKHGIKTILAEMLLDSPEWLYAQCPAGRVESADGRQRQSEMHISCATGGHYCVCLDHPEIEQAARRSTAAIRACWATTCGTSARSIRTSGSASALPRTDASRPG